MASESANLKLALAALAGMMLAEVPQVLSGFLPSPSTAYDKASGAISSGSESLKVLRVSEVKGIVVTVVMAGAVSLMAQSVVGKKAWLLFAAAMAILLMFIMDFEGAIRKGLKKKGQSSFVSGMTG